MKAPGHHREAFPRAFSPWPARLVAFSSAAFWLLSATTLSAAEVDYPRDVKPIFEKRCSGCHGRLKQKSDLRLDAGLLIHKGGKHGPVINPGKSSDSPLIQRVRSSSDDERMPPEGKPLTSEQVHTLQAWIDAGAPYPANEKVPSAPGEHWAFQRVVRPPVPAVKDRHWLRNPIDRFVLAKLEARAWLPNPPAPPHALLRRVCLDLTGLPPSRAEQEAFLANPSPEALDRVIDDLLERPSYGERWARHWLDVVRYADSNGYERDAAKPFVWRYRDYVIRALNTDKPFDRFILEQIAGDELPEASADTHIATGFHRLGHWDDEPADFVMDRFDQLDDIVSSTSQAFLALTLACARCHDHKFEPLSTRDYYSMVAVFNPLQRPQNGRTELTLPVGTPSELAALAERDRRIGQLRKEMAEWREAFRSTWLKGTRSALPAEAIRAFLIPPDKQTESEKKLVREFHKKLEAEIENVLPQETKDRIAGHEHRIAELREATPDLPQAYRLHEPSPKPPGTYVLVRGNPAQKGSEVFPAVPAVLIQQQPPFPEPGERTTRRRTGLAQWIASPDNPLTARVIVNRIWQQHFGAGLVRTPNDFGLMGEEPTHPELLDWLADWFVHDAGWSLKKLHRLVLTSQSWRLSRTDRPEYSSADPEKRLLWQLPYRRLEVEAIRDSILAVSGQLNPRLYGPSMFPPVPPQALEGNSDPDKIWKPSPEAEASRRTIYAFIKRGMVIPMLEVLDLCDTVHSSPRRQVTTVAPQALTLFNSEFVNTQAKHFAARLRSEAGQELTDQIQHAYRLALCRLPNAAEMKSMLAFLETARDEPPASPSSSGPTASVVERRQRSLEQLCRVLFNLNEFVYPD